MKVSFGKTINFVFRTVVVLLVLFFATTIGFECEFMDLDCGWTWSDGFVLSSGENLTHLGVTAPSKNSRNDTKGQFLYFSPKFAGEDVKLELSSPPFTEKTKEKCTLELLLHMYNMDSAVLKILFKGQDNTLETRAFHGNSFHRWERHQANIGEITPPFKVLLEFIDSHTVQPSHLAIEDIRAIDCYDKKPTTDCAKEQFQCSNQICIQSHKVCNLMRDCVEGEDESRDCDKLPEGAYCTFETGYCGWKSTLTDGSIWEQYRGDSPNPRTGPSFDHTFGNQSEGYYMLARFPSGRAFGSQADLESPVFEPPPYAHRSVHSQFYNSCEVRFFFHQLGKSVGDLTLLSYELAPGMLDTEKRLWRSFGNKGDRWHETVVRLPPIANKYYLVFSAKRGMGVSDIAVDDISLSPKCFGIGIPFNETIDPNDEYTTPLPSSPRPPQTKRIAFNTCGAKGRFGPTEELCLSAYKNSTTSVSVSEEPSMEGAQMWKVPSDGIYTIFVSGAEGGGGILNRERSLGASLRATFHWKKDETIFIVVGQQGTDACSKVSDGKQCEKRQRMVKRDNMKHLRAFVQAREKGGGGGGGGGTYVFKIDPTNQKIALVVAGGGGGLSAEVDTKIYIDPQGMGINNSVTPINGHSGPEAGGGGGWDDDSTGNIVTAGQALKKSARGGEVCEQAKSWMTDGGFGGGGGGCASGGGGGGYRGGDASVQKGPFYNGYGGTSYHSEDALRPLVEAGQNDGDGSVTIIPAQPGCGCQYLCVFLDLKHEEHYCICPNDQTLNIDGFTCNGGKPFEISTIIVVVIAFSIIVVLALCAISTHFALSRFRKSQNYHEPLRNPEVQLSRLRNEARMVTELNPNYQFNGSTCSVRDLKEIPREQLTLVKALGQGAFGEVYQGFLTNPVDNTEKPVAVKTLPELSSSQAEMDFLMEALIMSKFNHPNIVTFIGVCFEKMPRFIVLELLQGGELKSFLREHRPKPNKPSTLTVSDLLDMALDVARGCQYLEENHFIHRDIAARNCLLTSKGEDRVVKIADFGMARDIYRADYYRKGGKAMLPVKWMPPEAFLDGIFTTKTDIWSFGVLLWEVISMGYMPYPGRGNQEVMQLVTSGGRLEPPTSCPSPVYHIMMQCWHPLPIERPNFTTLIERLGYCLQDPDVINAPLPVFNRPPSMERDATVMRPADEDSGDCLQVHRPEASSLLSPGSEDYLIPMPQSMYSLTNTATDHTDLQSSPSVGSSDQLLEMSDRGRSGGETPPSSNAGFSTSETNFMTLDNIPPASDTMGLSTPDDQVTTNAMAASGLKKKSGGYIEVPSEDDDTEIKAQETVTQNGPKTPEARKSSVHSVDDLPLAPEVSKPNSKNDNQPSGSSHSNLALDPSALAGQVGNGENLMMPRRYINVDVNCNTGMDSTGSATRIGTSDQTLTNRNSVLVPLEGYSGVNPVA